MKRNIKLVLFCAFIISCLSLIKVVSSYILNEVSIYYYNERVYSDR